MKSILQDICEKKMSLMNVAFFGTSASHVLLRRFLFWKKLEMEEIILSYKQKVFRSTSLDEKRFEFECETDRIFHWDKCDIHFSLKLQLFKERLFDAFKREKAEHIKQIRD